MLDQEGLGGHLGQRSTWVVKQGQGLVTGVLDDGNDLEVVDAVDLLGSGERQGQAWRSSSSYRGGDEGDQCRTEGRGEHVEGCDETSWTDWLECRGCVEAFIRSPYLSRRMALGCHPFSNVGTLQWTKKHAVRELLNECSFAGQTCGGACRDGAVSEYSRHAARRSTSMHDREVYASTSRYDTTLVLDEQQSPRHAKDQKPRAQLGGVPWGSGV